MEGAEGDRVDVQLLGGDVVGDLVVVFMVEATEQSQKCQECQGDAEDDDQVDREGVHRPGLGVGWGRIRNGEDCLGFTVQGRVDARVKQLVDGEDPGGNRGDLRWLTS